MRRRRAPAATPASRPASVLLRCAIPAALLALVTAPASLPQAALPMERPWPPATAGLERFDTVWRLTTERFFDLEMRGVDWTAARATYRPRAAAARNERELAAVVNEMLGELGSSHTRFYTDRDPEYYFLRAVFRESLGQPYLEWDDPGLTTVRLPEGTFVRDLLDGGPGARAGLRVGDRVVDADAQGPFDPVETFEGRAGRPSKVSTG